MVPTPEPRLRRKISSVLFDVDGLLLGTENIYTKCFGDLFARWDIVFDAQFKLRIMGKRQKEIAELCVAEKGVPVSVEAFQQLALEGQLREMAKCELMPGARRVVEGLARAGVPLAVATSSARITFDEKSRRHADVFALMTAIVTGDDPAVKNSKPAPDIFLEAARRLGADPASCLVFEDSPNGVRAALAANMQVVWVPDPAFDFAADHHDLLVHPKVVRLQSLDHFDPQPWSLPALE